MEYPPAYPCFGVDYTNYESVNRHQGDQVDGIGIHSRRWGDYYAQQRQYKKKQLQFEREKNEQLQRTLEQKISELSDLLDNDKPADWAGDSSLPPTRSATNQLHSLSIAEQKRRYESDRDNIVRLRRHLEGMNSSPPAVRSADAILGVSHGFPQYTEWSKSEAEDGETNGYETWTDLTEDEQDVPDSPQVTDTWESLNLAAQVRVESKISNLKLESVGVRMFESGLILIFCLGKGIGGMHVMVLDTINNRQDNFISQPPQTGAGQKFVDPEFDEQTALGKYASYTGWMRPEVSMLAFCNLSVLF